MAENQTGAKPVETFETSLDELEKVVRELEGGDLPLERSLELFERGVALSDSCRTQGGLPITASIVVGPRLAPVLRKFLDFYDMDMLQRFESERFLFDRVSPGDRDIL